jgi:transcriptional regulator with XRE-family HTH domain
MPLTLLGSDNFRTRFHQGLHKVACPADSPIAVAREFNRRHAGAPVTAHAVRKWLLGESIPTQARLRTIAAWLEVSPAWLVFGANEAPTQRLQAGTRPAAGIGIDPALLADYHVLDEAHRYLVRQFVQTLLKVQSAQRRPAPIRGAPVL